MQRTFPGKINRSLNGEIDSGRQVLSKTVMSMERMNDVLASSSRHSQRIGATEDLYLSNPTLPDDSAVKDHLISNVKVSGKAAVRY